MTSVWSLVAMPVTGAIIGWGTNVVAIRMLFYPHQPWTVPWLGWRIQGLLPRHQEDFARALGQVVADHLVRNQEIMAQLDLERLHNEMVQRVALYVDQRLQASLPAFLPGGWRAAATHYVEQAVAREAGSLLAQALPQLVEQASSRLDVAAMVEEKVRAFNLEELEKMIRSLSSRELQAIERWGLALGGLVGLLQACIVWVLG